MNPILFIVVFLTACAPSQPAPIKVVSIESTYQPYVDAFQERAREIGTNVSIANLIIQSVPQLSTNIIAQCEHSTINGVDQPPTISVSQLYWKNFDVTYREQVIFHEMGHCVLNRVHRPELNSGIPISIMNPYSFGGNPYVSNYKQYINELFNQTDLASSLPLLLDDVNNPTYIATLSAITNDVPTVTASSSKHMRIEDKDAPETTTLSDEVLSQLRCGEE